MIVISRAPNDYFTFDLSELLLKGLVCEYNAYYIWANPPHVISTFFESNFNKSKNVIIGIKDMLDLWGDYHYWNKNGNGVVDLIVEVAKKYPETNFVILTSLDHLEKEISEQNIQIISWGGDCVNQCNEYKILDPVVDKNFKSEKHVISLNRNYRAYRIVYLSYLLGRNLETCVNLSCLGISTIDLNVEPNNFMDRINWVFENSEEHNRIRDILIEGYRDKFFNNTDLIKEEYNIYQRSNDNITNFNTSLRSKYQSSFLEIVTESCFTSPSFMVTEKTMHCFYGCNFPIILGGCGIVAHLREVGFDMFDDIIDHSYDLISNPIDRIVRAIDDNERLLVDPNYVKDLWIKHKQRILNNVDVARKISDFYKARAIDQWNNVVWK